MKNQSKYFLVILMITLASACGSGGNQSKETSVNNSTAVNTATPAVSSFTEVPNAFPDPSIMVTNLREGAQQLGLKINAVGIGFSFQMAVDLNSDGKKELLVGASAYSYPGSFASEPGYARLYVFELNNLGRFEDQTNKFIEGTPIIRSQWGAGTIFDLNSDGRPDIVFATNQEDGRNEDLGSDFKAYPVALISQLSGKHKLITFGQYAWNLNQPIGFKSKSGEQLVLINNNGWRVYVHQSGQIVETDQFSVTDFANLGGIFTRTFQDNNNRYLISGGVYPNVYALRSFEVDNNLSLIQLDSVDIGYKAIATSNYKTWQGSIYPVNVLTDGADYYLGGGGFGLDGGCVIREKNQPIKILSWGGLPKIIDYKLGVEIVNIGEVKNIIVQYSFNSGKLSPIPVSISDWDKTTSRWGTYCEDLNEDGYDDIWVHALRPGTRDFFPIIYINQKDGTFKRVPDSDFPNFQIPNEARLALLVSDFNGDGLADFVSIPEIGDGVIEKESMKYFRGVKRLNP